MPTTLMSRTFVAQWHKTARDLVQLRDAWLNPSQTFEVSETSKVSRERTLTNLCNARPTWLDNAHRKLDAAVCAAYGWLATLSDKETGRGCWRSTGHAPAANGANSRLQGASCRNH